MAFATTNVQRSAFGNLKVTFGDWSGAVGDAAGTLTLEGGRVYLCSFTTQDGTGPISDSVAVVSTSGTAGVITLTVYNVGDVTKGRFLVVHS